MIKLIRKILAFPIRLSTMGFKKGPHIWRFQMYRHMAALGKELPINAQAKVLAVSGSERLCRILGFNDDQLTIAEYPDYNLMDLSFEDHSFDFVVSDQVLEHLDGNPQDAFDESHRVLKAGGYAIHTTCFTQEVHYGPEDFWRFSPSALAYLARNFSGIVDNDGWGNRMMWIYIWLGLRMQGIPEATWHPVHKLATMNNKRWPAVTWVVAQK